MSDRFVVLGLAGGRAPWFANVGQWAHAGTVSCEFVKCMSAEQLRARLRSGRLHSATLLDGTLPSVDRDLVAAAHEAGAAVLIVDDPTRVNHWAAIGADAVLASAFSPAELVAALRTHAAAVATGEWHPSKAPDPRPVRATAPLAALCGPGGTGVSTLAIALAQGVAAGPERQRVLLADLCLRAEQAALHDAGDVGPGIQELVDQARTVTPTPSQVQDNTFAVKSRGYSLLLGLRQSAYWSALRPRAIAAAVSSMRDAFDVVVCDCDSDLEGQAQGGSLEIEERNALSRTALLAADVVFVVGLPGLKGVYSLARVLIDVCEVGIPADRVTTVFNRCGRNPRSRARLGAALSALLPPEVAAATTAPLFVPERDVEIALHDGTRLPSMLADPLVVELKSACGRTPTTSLAPELRPVAAGIAGAWPEEVPAT